MTLPIDEMLSDLRDALEAFEASQNDANFASVWLEAQRIEAACEDLMGDEE